MKLDTANRLSASLDARGGFLGRAVVGASAPANGRFFPARLAMQLAEPAQELPIESATLLSSETSSGSDAGGS
jgi:hypothetical protein